LRVYLGAAPGVGKTYAMLGEGHRRADRGTDVVLAFVECHGRRHTEELVEGLPSVPPRVLAERGVSLREMDVDAVLRRHPRVALVGMEPEALRRRLAHGNVYAPEEVDAALGSYFRPGNLTALRELALLWTADKVDEALQRYRTEHHIAATWEARERVVVALT